MVLDAVVCSVLHVDISPGSMCHSALNVQVRKATEEDLASMLDIFRAVADAGDALPFSVAMDNDTFRDHWFGAHVAHVATIGPDIVAMYKMGPNHPGRGSHTASATYLVSLTAQDKGIGRSIVEHSIDLAKDEGFLAMQFNYVVSTNTPALKLYEKLGFAIVGTLPKAFRHRQAGLVDAHVMYRQLQ